MAETLHCSNGHSWTPAFRREVWPPDFRSACPVCGEGPMGPFDMTRRTIRILVALAVAFFLVGLAVTVLGPHTVGSFVLAGIAGLVAAGWLHIRRNRERTRRMAEVARAMDFAFMASLTVSSLRAVAPFSLFTYGEAASAYRGMQGRVGDRDLLFFEYEYSTGGEEPRTTYVSAVMIFDGAAGVPDFRLAPKTALEKVLGFFMPNSVVLENSGEFTKCCKLTGPDPAALRETFHPDLVHYLAIDGRWFIEAVGGQLLLYRTPAVPSDLCPDLVTDALEIRDMLRGAGRRT